MRQLAGSSGAVFLAQNQPLLADPRHVITYDFLEDSTVDGRKLRCLTIVDK